MNESITDVMNAEERLVFALRALFCRYGYRPYRMSKFEEYDLYAKNKDFLISEDVIVFTDKGGRLMALKPDVTLSIVNSVRVKKDAVERLCYNENVYRVPKGGVSFSEIMQTGLECIGDIDAYCVGEVLCLAAASLDLISHRFALDVSHIGLLSAAVASLSLPKDAARKVCGYVSAKNVHEIMSVCRENGVSEEKANALSELTSLYGTPSDVMPKVKRIAEVFSAEAEYGELSAALSVLETSPFRDRVRVDFSVVGDAGYYNGVVFKGFVDGVPEAVLSGGRYDGLLKKMKCEGGAAGFAVYLDTLAPIFRGNDTFSENGAGTVLLYDRDDDPAKVAEAVSKLASSGQSVEARRRGAESVIGKKVVELKGCDIYEV